MNKKPVRQGRQSAADAELTKSQILNSAFELFTVKGFDATSLREIATAAEVSHGTLRHHFGSKDSIWFAFADRHIETYQRNLHETLQQHQIDQHSALERFKAVVTVLVDTLLANPKTLRLMSQEHDMNNKRAQYLAKSMMETHLRVTELFNAAQSESKRLSIYTADTFLIALMGLISSPTMFPFLDILLKNKQDKKKEVKTEYREFVLSILFG